MSKDPEIRCAFCNRSYPLSEYPNRTYARCTECTEARKSDNDMFKPLREFIIRLFAPGL